jgi:hypothetical protein
VIYSGSTATRCNGGAALDGGTCARRRWHRTWWVAALKLFDER